MVLDLTPPRLQKLCHLLPRAWEWGWGRGSGVGVGEGLEGLLMIRGGFVCIFTPVFVNGCHSFCLFFLIFARDLLYLTSVSLQET